MVVGWVYVIAEQGKKNRLRDSYLRLRVARFVGSIKEYNNNIYDTKNTNGVRKTTSV